MTRQTRFAARIGSVTCALALACAAPSAAQAQRVDGPYSGILGGGPTADRTQGLDFRGSLFGAYDQNIFDGEPTGLDPRLAASGGGGGATGSLNYQRAGDRLRFDLAGSGAARAYPTDKQPIAAIYSANTALSANLTSKIVADVSGNATYSPFYNFAPFVDGSYAGGAIGGPGYSYAAVAQRNVWMGATAGITDSFSKQSSLSVRANRTEVRMLDDASNTVQSTSVEAMFRHALSRSLSLHLGYGRQFADYSLTSAASYRNDMFDVGVDYGNSVNLSRRTSLAFSASTGAIRYLNDTHFRVDGSLQLARGFGRTWAGFVAYTRNTTFDAGFIGPLLNDSVLAGIGGQFSARTRWWSGVGATRGTAGFDPRPFTTYGASTRFDMALTRTLGFYGQYGYYRYEVPQGLSTFTILPRFARGSATVGLSVWLPLVNEISAPKEPKQQP